MRYIWVGSISIKTDGSEDCLVHCIIKPGGMAADAAAVISAETAILLCDINDDVDTDPFGSDKEFEDNETIVDEQNSQTLDSSTYMNLH